MHSKDFLVTVCKPAHGYDHGYFGFDHFIITRTISDNTYLPSK